MALTQESVLFWLVNEGGQVKKSEIVGHFKGLLGGVDPAEKQRNRELFKTCVNSVATVREVDGVRCVVLKEVYRHLLHGAQTAEEPGHEEIPGAGEPRSRSGVSEAGEEPSGEGEGSPAELLSPVQLALRRSKVWGVGPKKMLNFDMQQMWRAQERAAAQCKPCALPLRMPASVEVSKLKTEPPERSMQASPQSERRSHLKERGCGSPQLRRPAKSAKAPEEPREARASSSSTVPLEDWEHEWLFRCAAGHWTQVYGLLLRDSHLAEKRDFMSGFTALHWAAKWGNGNMLVKIIDLAKEVGVQLDINAKTHGGYTPLHIAVLHNQEYVITMLLGEYDADPNIRDNCGKRPHHYLRTGASGAVREMLVKPKARPSPETVQGEELEPSGGRHSVTRHFQPHVTGQKKKKLKQRPVLWSLSEESGGEPQDGAVFRNRTASDAWM